MSEGSGVAPPKKRRSGIPTENAGEYFVMGELLKRGYDAQLADRNTKGYDLLVGQPGDKVLRKVQVKSVRVQPWYVNIGRAAAIGTLVVTRTYRYAAVEIPMGRVKRVAPISRNSASSQKPAVQRRPTPARLYIKNRI